MFGIVRTILEALGFNQARLRHSYVINIFSLPNLAGMSYIYTYT